MKTFRGFRPISHLTKRPHWFLAAILAFALLLRAAPWALSASVSIAGPTTLLVSGNYVGGTNGYNGTSWSSASTNFAYRLSGTPAGKNNRNTPNATGDTSGTLDPTLSSLTSFTMLPDGTVTISGTFASALGAADFSPYGGQFLSIGLINEAWVAHARSGYSSDMFTSASGADGNAYLIFYREAQGSPVFAAMEDHAGGRATAADRRDVGGLGLGVTAFSIQFQSGVDKSGSPASGTVRGRMRYSLNGGAYGAWDNNSHDFVGQNTAILLAATTSKGYSFGATLGTVDINTSPVADDDSYSVAEDATLTIVAPGVLSNDSDPDGDSFVGALASGPSHGALSFSSDGSFVYTPDVNYNGPDSFSYKAIDSRGGEDTATVSLTVTPVDDAPIAHDDSYSTAEDTPLNVPAAGVLANDSDPDTGDTLTAVLVSGPSHGALTLNADGSFAYTPDANYNGPDSFSYKARDTANQESGAATVSLTVTPVDDAPTAAGDSYSTTEDTPLNVSAAGVLANDSDPDTGDTLSAVLASGPSHGTLTLNADGSFDYTPTANYNGADSFSYKARDTTTLESSAATVSLTVTPVNDAPTAHDDSYSTAEDTPLNVPAAGVLANDDNLDGGSLSAVLVSGPSHGALTLNADGSFGYTPDANYNGPDSFSYLARDAQADDSAAATVSLTITPADDAPTAAGDSYSTAEDTPLHVPAAGVLANDGDPDIGDTLSAVLASGSSHGTLTLNADGSFDYTPDANYNGPDSFSYLARDTTNLESSAATVSLTVTPVNDAPTAAADSYSTAEDIVLNVPAAGVLANDDNPDGGSLSAVLVSGPSHGALTLNADGSFGYTPDANYNGADSFSYLARDAQADDSAVATVSLTITPVNDAPTAAADSYSTAEDTVLNVSAAGVLVNDSDPESDSIVAVLASGPAHGALTLNADGSFGYMPAANYNGADSFSYKARDTGGALSGLATVSLTITPVNDAPTAHADSYSTAEDTPLNVPAGGVLVNDANPDDGSLSAVLVSGPSHGALVLNADGSFGYTPDANYNGADSFSYLARDAQADDSAAVAVSLSVTAVDDAPAFTAGANQTINEDAGPQTVVGWASAIVAGPADEAGQALNFLVTNNNAALFSAQPAVASDGTLTFTAAANANGSATVTVRLHDSGGTANGGADTSAPQTFQIVVTSVNDNPTASNDTARVLKDSGANALDVLANDSDAPDTGETLTITAVTQAGNGGVTIAGGGTSLSYTPDAGYEGADSFTYTISDGNGGTATATVDVAVRRPIVYLPFILGPAAPPAQPDLVASFSLSKAPIAPQEPVVMNVTITNAGDAPASQFWVDFYINPTTPPTAANQPWNTSCGSARCAHGIAWYVSETIAPGQSITLKSTADSYYAANTDWPGYFDAGPLDLYLYVDSWNPGVAGGAVDERDETNNRAEMHTTTSGLNIGALPEDHPLADLPVRPARPTTVRAR